MCTMREITRNTLEGILREFPTIEWTADELGELVAPRFGIISGFGDLLDDIDKLAALDLRDVAPAGGLPVPPRS